MLLKGFVVAVCPKTISLAYKGLESSLTKFYIGFQVDSFDNFIISSHRSNFSRIESFALAYLDLLGRRMTFPYLQR